MHIGNTGKPLEVLIVGGGMITHDQILPALYHLQRTGLVSDITISARRVTTLKTLAAAPMLLEGFPGQSFRALPELTESEDASFPELYREALRALPPRQCVVLAVPDQYHYDLLLETIAHDQHILVVKPLVLKYEQAEEVKRAAAERGVFVCVEYHKRFDRRALIARRDYRKGRFGEFAIGEAKMIEPWYYRTSNFQTWFTSDQTDPFVYVGCHYVDMVYFITGLKPAAVSVQGVKGRFPNGNEAYLWANGRVVFENGAVLSVTSGLGYPDAGAGSNEQGLIMYCEGDGCTGLIQHDDQSRGVAHSYLDGSGPGGSTYNYVNPDYFKLVPWEGDGLKPVGYGYESVAAALSATAAIEHKTSALSGAAALERRRELIAEIDAAGLLATPANSWINELVQEAARASILNNGMLVDICYTPEPHIQPRA